MFKFFINKDNLLAITPVTIVYSLCLYFLKVESDWILSTVIFFITMLVLFPSMVKFTDWGVRQWKS